MAIWAVQHNPVKVKELRVQETQDLSMPTEVQALKPLKVEAELWRSVAAQGRVQTGHTAEIETGDDVLSCALSAEGI